MEKDCIYVIEPHPDDALGSASALIYSYNTSVTVCTLTRTMDSRDQINLVHNLKGLKKSLRRPMAVTGQEKFFLDDLHWNLRKNINMPYEEALNSYYELYGTSRKKQLKETLMTIIEKARKYEAHIAFPLGLVHPMHIMVSGMMVECVKETGFALDKLWIFVDHPYDIYCIGSSRMKDCVDYIKKQTGGSFFRYDAVDTDQTTAGEALRIIYGDVHHAEFSDSFRKTFCSFYLTKERYSHSQYLQLRNNQVLFLTDQALPYYKRGGLGDVSYTFVKSALNYADQIRIMMPFHGWDNKENLPGRELDRKEFELIQGQGEKLSGVLREHEYEGIIYYLIDVPGLLRQDEVCRYAVYADIIIGRLLPLLDFEPNILHCNDWHMGFIPFLFKTKYRNYLSERGIKLLYTIHSYGYQGICNKSAVLEMVGLDRERCELCPVCQSECPLENITYLGKEQQKLIGTLSPISASFMKAGIYYSDQVSTVSQGYAQELESYPELKRIKISGIRNGFGPEILSPYENKNLFHTYSHKDFKEGKAFNKLEFQARCGFNQSLEIPMLCMVSRLSKVKGIDGIIVIAEKLLDLPLQLVIVGDDDDGVAYSSVLKKLMQAHKGHFKYLSFEPKLEFQVYAASDILLMPSLSESCGMTQILAMYYGVVPIVSMLSGLRDTVAPIYEETMDKGVGYLTYQDNCWMLLEVIMVVLQDFKNKDFWNRLVEKNMITDFRWENGSLKSYMQLYHSLIR